MSEDNKGCIIAISVFFVVFLIILILMARSDVSDSERVSAQNKAETERVKLRYQFELDSLKIARSKASTH